MAEEGTVIWICVEVMDVAVRKGPVGKLSPTFEPGLVNPVPVIVSVNAGPPMRAVEGLMLVSVSGTSVVLKLA